MFDRDNLVEVLAEEFQARNESVLKEEVQKVVDTLVDLGYVIVQNHVPTSAQPIGDFERIIASWNANSTVEPEDVNGEQVLQALVGEGWIIIPPSQV